MIIKTSSDKELKKAFAIRRVFYKEREQMVYIVPKGITSILITFNDDLEELVLYLKRGEKNLDSVGGFDNLEQCRDYARLIAVEAGLSTGKIIEEVQ